MFFRKGFSILELNDGIVCVDDGTGRLVGSNDLLGYRKTSVQAVSRVNKDLALHFAFENLASEDDCI